MLSSAGGSSPALHAEGRLSDDRPSCLENPRPAGAESTLTENVASPFQAEPRHSWILPPERGRADIRLRPPPTAAGVQGSRNELSKQTEVR
jgi:hypothetical protein